MSVGEYISPFFSRLGGDKNDHQLCYVTIIMVPSVLPARTCDIVSVHTSYDLVPPFPSFVPSLSLKLPGKENGRGMATYGYYYYCPILKPTCNWCRLLVSQHWMQSCGCACGYGREKTMPLLSIESRTVYFLSSPEICNRCSRRAGR